MSMENQSSDETYKYAAEGCPECKEANDLLIAIANEPNTLAVAQPGGIAAAFDEGCCAVVHGAGIAYSSKKGTAHGGPNGVSFSKAGGLARSSNGGISISHRGGDSECGAFGIAYSHTNGPVGLGSVRGMEGSTLVIGWKSQTEDFSKTVRVGDTVDGICIEKNVWYSLDPKNSYKWIQKNPEQTD